MRGAVWLNHLLTYDAHATALTVTTMFSTLSSFLPSALQPTDDKRQSSENSSKRVSQLNVNTGPAAPSEPGEQTATASETKPAEEAARKRKRNTHEVCNCSALSDVASVIGLGC